ncbi:MAG: GNAT family N-acetyltransferase [Verrucomicrobiota bacterium]|nr:GNAT family N-acetyltransferase [Verrucomicrobiota bacterium]
MSDSEPIPGTAASAAPEQSSEIRPPTLSPFSLETDRLRLRHLTIDDAAFILELLNEPAFIRYVADRNIRTVKDAAAYIREKIISSYQLHGFGFYLVATKADGASLGICGFIKRETLNDVDIGFAFLEHAWGQGYAFEAATAVMAYGTGELGLPRVVAVTSPQNRASIALLQKLGLKFTKMIQLPGYRAETKFFA